ncbi:serine hydrolase [uncultured Bacteroides sp.]|uniref:serine hydrolase domain-containing protein n=1 Tax=uncultured Bacteroides sp. TaxID=162156 RepID=UPI00262F3813|nr:serine hydrolase domain-containing protein [uncultured Bacteroides sp.]
MKRKWIIPAVIAVAAVIVYIICSSSIRSCSDTQSGLSAAADGYRLNAHLSNTISDCPGLQKMDRDIERFLQKWGIMGASLAVSRNDSLLYAKGYGWAEEEKGEKMEPSHILRVASVSKLVTAVGIMKLQEQRKLNLHDKVFGPQGILNDTAYTRAITDKRYFRITVEDLLRHRAGFTNAQGDPMFATRYIMMGNKLTAAPDHDTLLKIVLKRRLRYDPGTWQRYSNFGYMVLSMVIEKVSGMDYETFMKKEVLEPAGCYDFEIAGNYYQDKHDDEVKYYMHAKADLIDEYNNSGRQVVRCYGGSDVHGLAGAGAWCASAAELSRLVASIDMDPTIPDILSRESVRTMTTYIDDNTFPLGWADIKKNGEWVRSGTLSGTSALVKHYQDGECWILITNTSTWRGPYFTHEIARLFETCRKKYGSAFPKRNLFMMGD